MSVIKIENLLVDFIVDSGNLKMIVIIKSLLPRPQLFQLPTLFSKRARTLFQDIFHFFSRRTVTLFDAIFLSNFI